MKKKYGHLTNFIVLQIALCLFMQGCGSKRQFIRNPLDEYRTDAFFFRAIGEGRDESMQTAKLKAEHLAKIEIARSAQSVCRQVILDYIDQTGNGENIDLKEQFMSVSVETVSASLVKAIVEDVFYEKDKDKDNKYVAYAKVKIAVENVIQNLEDGLRNKTSINEILFKQLSDKVINQKK